MEHKFEYYLVDPGTWKDVRPINTVTNCSIDRDSDADTLGSATIDIAESISECYIRVYLITIQNGVTERHPLGTFLIQTPGLNFNGVTKTFAADAYTPLLELKENQPPLGYSLFKGENVMNKAYQLVRERVRAPVVATSCQTTLPTDFVSNTSDNWLTFTSDLINTAKYSLELDEMGRVLFSPQQKTSSMQPVWTYDDGNSSILYPDITMDNDLYGIPNVVEVFYSQDGVSYHSRVVNDDGNSPVSTVNRGREIVHRVVNPNIGGIPSQPMVDEYAKQLLREMSSLVSTISYTHGYCGTRLGDCVRLNYERAGLKDIKARIVSQSIKCTPGCPVSETAVFTTKLWG
jgi:hypothetical protein